VATERWLAITTRIVAGNSANRLLLTLAMNKMTTIKTKILICLSSIVLLSIFVIIGFYYPNYRTITFHNRCIDQAKHNITEVQIAAKEVMMDNGQPRTVTITDKAKILFMLERFRLSYPYSLSQSYHACGGNIAITLKSMDDQYYLSYDHGNGVYPISSDKLRKGFIVMNKSVCSELNAYLRSLGFTDMEIGNYNK